MIDVPTYSLPVEDEAVTVAGHEDEVNRVIGELAVSVSADIAVHTDSTDNPHGTTAAQIGLGSVDNTPDMSKPVSPLQQAAIDTAVSTHTGNTDNPHGLTADQLGLGDVDNTPDAAKPVSALQQAAIDTAASAKLDADEVDPPKYARSGYVGLILDAAGYALFGLHKRTGEMVGTWASSVNEFLTKYSAIFQTYTEYARSGVAWAITDENGFKGLWLKTNGDAMSGRYNLTEAAKSVAGYDDQIAEIEGAQYSSIKQLYIGDSTVYGSGSGVSNAGLSNPAAKMKAAYPDTEATHIAIGGDDADNQARFFGAIPVRFANETIPSDGIMTLTGLDNDFMTPPDSSTMTCECWLGPRVHGTLVQSSGVYTFTADEAPGVDVDLTYIERQLIVDRTEYKNRTISIALGINDSDEELLDGRTLQNIKRIVESLAPFAPTIWVETIWASSSSTDARWEAIFYFNDQLVRHFGNMVFDRYNVLLESYDDSDPDEVEAYNNGFIVERLMPDKIHPNDEGYTILHDARVLWCQSRNIQLET